MRAVAVEHDAARARRPLVDGADQGGHGVPDRSAARRRGGSRLAPPARTFEGATASANTSAEASARPKPKASTGPVAPVHDQIAATMNGPAARAKVAGTAIMPWMTP